MRKRAANSNNRFAKTTTTKTKMNSTFSRTNFLIFKNQKHQLVSTIWKLWDGNTEYTTPLQDLEYWVMLVFWRKLHTRFLWSTVSFYRCLHAVTITMFSCWTAAMLTVTANRLLQELWDLRLTDSVDINIPGCDMYARSHPA